MLRLICSKMSRWLVSLRRLRDERNALVHSVWAQPGWGWRPDIHAKAGAGEPHIFYRTDKESVQDVIAELVTLIEQIDRFQQRGHTQKGRRLVYGESATQS
jgi:hypothetical protein